MAPRKKTTSPTLAELEKQREALNEAIRLARTKRKSNFQTAMTALTENELVGNDSITGFDIESVIGALVEAKKRVKADPALLEQFRTIGRNFIDTAQDPLSEKASKAETVESRKAETDQTSPTGDSSPNDKTDHAGTQPPTGNLHHANDGPSSQDSFKLSHGGTDPVPADRQAAG